LVELFNTQQLISFSSSQQRYLRAFQSASSFSVAFRNAVDRVDDPNDMTWNDLLENVRFLSYLLPA
jgi:hypothetical protein